MKRIIFADSRRWRRKAILNGKGGSRLFFFCADTDPIVSGTLRRAGYRQITRPCADERSRAGFLAGYIDLIGMLGKNNDCLEWWATDIASKNRFTSNITGLLDAFLACVETVRSGGFEELVILDAPAQILPSLYKALAQEGTAIVKQRSSLRPFITALACRVRWFLAQLFNGWRTYAHARYARKELGQDVMERIRALKRGAVVKTFVYRHSFRGDIYADVFFGRLPEFIRKTKNVVFFACILGDYKSCIREIKRCNSAVIAPVELFLTFRDLREAWGRMMAWKPAVKPCDFFGYDVSGIFQEEFKRRSKDIQFYHFLHYWMTRRLTELYEPEEFVLTCENNPWEKMCAAALRECSPRTRIIGYQHTIVSQASANMFVSKHEAGSMPGPDLILTVGNANKRIMERYGDFRPGTVRPSCGLRFEYLFSAQRLGRKKEGKVLLALEGIKEVHSMVAYALAGLGNVPGIEVRVRCHPVLPWEHFRKTHGFDLGRYRNVHLSPPGPLKHDLEWADIVVYWGSTIGVEALNMGRPVVHYDNGAVLSFDPLFECPHLKFVCGEGTDLAAIVTRINGLSDEEFETQYARAKAYLDDYFTPVSDKAMGEFLAKPSA